MSLQVLAADCYVVGHIEGREGFDSWACLVEVRPDPFHQWHEWGVPAPGCDSCQEECVGGSWGQVGIVNQRVHQGEWCDAGKRYAGLLCHCCRLGYAVLLWV